MFYLFLGEKKLTQQAIVSTELQKNALLLFCLIFLIPKVKELIALVIKQTINAEDLRR